MEILFFVILLLGILLLVWLFLHRLSERIRYFFTVCSGSRPGMPWKSVPPDLSAVWSPLCSP